MPFLSPQQAAVPLCLTLSSAHLKCYFAHNRSHFTRSVTFELIYRWIFLVYCCEVGGRNMERKCERAFISYFKVLMLLSMKKNKGEKAQH